MSGVLSSNEQLTHGRNCSARFRSNSDCTCGLQWRIQIQTEQTMHAAWRKRAEEAEAELERLRHAPETTRGAQTDMGYPISEHDQSLGAAEAGARLAVKTSEDRSDECAAQGHVWRSDGNRPTYCGLCGTLQVTRPALQRPCTCTSTVQVVTCNKKCDGPNLKPAHQEIAIADDDGDDL